MKIYLVSQDFNSGYNTYDAMIVSAFNKEDAKSINPTNGNVLEEHSYVWVNKDQTEHLSVKYLGETVKKRGILLASFNAG